MYATRPLPAESIDAILWGDLGPLDRVMVRSAHVLVRVVARLRERLDPRFDPFLALYDHIAAAPPEHFTRLWATPGWPAWALVAERLVHAPDSLDLAEHLAQFGGLAVGLALQTGEELRLETPWPAMLPVLVPGLEWQIEGEGTVLVRGVRDGTILFDQDGATAQPAPRAHRGGFSLAVSRTAGHLPWIAWPDGAVARAAGGNFHDAMLPLIEGALAAVARHAPNIFGDLPGRLLAVNLADPARGLTYSSSNSSLTGMMMLSGMRNPWELADAIIHEFHHNRLFAIEFERPLLRHEDGALHYSPWRDDARPIRGILHAVYVYCATASYWLDVHGSGVGDQALAGYAADQSARALGQLMIGLRVLERSASWTEFGAEAFAAMTAKAAILRRRSRERGIDLSRPAWSCHLGGEMRPKRSPAGLELTVGEDLRDHAARFDHGREVSDMIGSPGWSI